MRAHVHPSLAVEVQVPLRPVGHLGERSSCAARSPYGCCERAKRACAGLLPPAAALQPSCNGHSVSKSAIFDGHLCRQRAYFSCHISYLAVFSAKLCRSRVRCSQEVKTECSWPTTPYSDRPLNFAKFVLHASICSTIVLQQCTLIIPNSQPRPISAYELPPSSCSASVLDGRCSLNNHRLPSPLILPSMQ